MKTALTASIKLVALGVVAAASGCAKDPQILVTPFVLKHSSPPVRGQDWAPGGVQPATSGYERQVVENYHE